ncbi:MAG: hypothetical protein WCE21_05025 [Candidatus Babeliales bacterium]
MKKLFFLYSLSFTSMHAFSAERQKVPANAPEIKKVFYVNLKINNQKYNHLSYHNALELLTQHNNQDLIIDSVMTRGYLETRTPIHNLPPELPPELSNLIAFKERSYDSKQKYEPTSIKHAVETIKEKYALLEEHALELSKLKK